MTKATFGGGCFWCLDAVFRRVEGVGSVVAGYMGGPSDVSGAKPNPKPTYESVCSGKTGYAEIVQIDFDPSRVTYQDLLAVFFKIHDPTTLNRQGADVGTQYRSVIFCHDEAQQRAASELVSSLDADGIFDAKIVTQVVPATTFFPAETYHQNYFAANPGNPYCQAVVAPKVAKFLAAFRDKARQV